MPLKTHLDEQPTLNLTPMIDIVFLLIIFFMVGTKFTELERKIGLTVPEVPDRGALTAAPEKRVVNVYRDGAITLDQVPVSLDELTSRLSAAQRQYDELGVLVRGRSEGGIRPSRAGDQRLYPGRHQKDRHQRPGRCRRRISRWAISGSTICWTISPAAGCSSACCGWGSLR